MTENDAIAKFKRTSVLWESATNTEMVEAVKVAIQALEEIQQYRAIGTVEQLEWCKDASHWKELFKEKLEQYEAIGTVEELKSMKENGAFTGVELAQLAAMQMRLKEYSAIGTIEEFKALKEKAEPKKPIILAITIENGDEACVDWKCPVCGLNVIEEPPCQEYCQRCGQKLEWE